MPEKNIEVELRSFISKEKYEELIEFFKQKGRFLKEGNEETFYFDSKEDLRIQKNDFFSKIWMKKGKIHDDAREEIEIKFPREDFEKLEKIFSSVGFNVKIKWFRKRMEFLWNEINICLDYTKGYGYIVEFEKMSSPEEKEKTLDELREKFSELKVTITPREEFEKKFQDYEKNWKEFTKMKIFIASSKHHYNRIPEIKNSLEEMGYQVFLPNSFDNPFKEEQLKAINKEEHIKWKSEMLKRDNTNISPVDALLVLNLEKEGNPNYIGGATFLEIYKAWELGKKIFLFNPIPESNFKDELTAINPVILDGDLTKIKIAEEKPAIIKEFVSTVQIVKDKKALFTWNKKVNNWVPVGGHIEQNELPCDSVIRETKEETGLDIELISKEILSSDNLVQPFSVHLDHVKENHKHINLIYFAKVKSGKCFDIDDEGKELRWFSKEEINNTFLPNVREWGIKAIEFFDKLNLIEELK